MQLSNKELISYVNNLVQRFYPSAVQTADDFKKLYDKYAGSFTLEYMYRQYDTLHKNYTIIYTPTGLIREMVLDDYAFNKERHIIN